MSCKGKYPCEHGCGSAYDDLGYYDNGDCVECPLFGCEKDFECESCEETECIMKDELNDVAAEMFFIHNEYGRKENGEN